MNSAIQFDAVGEMQAQLVEFRADYGEDLAKELLELFLADSGPRLEVLTSAVLSSDPVTARREAHTLKGAAGNMGAASISAVCLDLEREIGSGDWGRAREDVTVLRQRLEAVRHHFSATAT